MACTEPCWTRPNPRQVKLNVDASFHADVGAGATGVVLCEYQGKFIAANCRYIANISSAAMVEAAAMKEGLALASRIGCNYLIAVGLHRNN